MQAQVNELVIETLADGVLVVDADGHRAPANPAARACWGRAGRRSAPFHPGRAPAWQAAGRAGVPHLRAPRAAEADVAWSWRAASAGGARAHPPHAAAGHRRQPVRDVPAGPARSRGALRTEKLAAMGRMSAAVAHEIRNPLAAITQANALLAEDLQDPAHRSSPRMVRKNAQRLAQIVDEVLNISRAQAAAACRRRAGCRWTTAVENRRRLGGQTQARGALRITMRFGKRRVRFDAEHLRR
jgi:two-component system sensor histidine kinase PilS (NtrC family)